MGRSKRNRCYSSSSSSHPWKGDVEVIELELWLFEAVLEEVLLFSFEFLLVEEKIREDAWD